MSPSLNFKLFQYQKLNSVIFCIFRLQEEAERKAKEEEARRLAEEERQARIENGEEVEEGMKFPFYFNFLILGGSHLHPLNLIYRKN